MEETENQLPSPPVSRGTEYYFLWLAVMLLTAALAAGGYYFLTELKRIEPQPLEDTPAFTALGEQLDALEEGQNQLMQDQMKLREQKDASPVAAQEFEAINARFGLVEEKLDNLNERLARIENQPAATTPVEKDKEEAPVIPPTEETVPAPEPQPAVDLRAEFDALLPPPPATPEETAPPLAQSLNEHFKGLLSIRKQTSATSDPYASLRNLSPDTPHATIAEKIEALPPEHRDRFASWLALYYHQAD